MTIENAIKILKDGRENLYGALDKSVPYEQQHTLAALDIAIKSLESLQTISNLFSKWQNGEVDDNEYFFQMQNILLFGKMIEGEVSE